MKFSNFGRKAAALVSTLALGAGLSSCGSGTIGYLYALGQLTNSGSFGQISGFKIDDRTGNLTNMVNSPYPSGGVNPGNAVVFPGGRFLFVLDKGTGGSTASVAEFLIGGDGVLTYQTSFYSQGLSPQWIAVDSSGRYLYVLDQVNPAGTTDVNGHVEGDITVFGVATDTGKLTVIPNQQVTVGGNTLLNYFPVGYKPTMVRVIGNFVYSLDTGDQTVYIYSSGTNGQLVAAQSAVQPTGGTNITSIGSTPGGSYVYITDAGNGVGPAYANFIRVYTVGSNGALASLNNSPFPNASLTSNPVWTLVSQNGKYLYVVNQGNNSNTPAAVSSITAFNILTTGQLSQIPDSPYPAGSGPVCMVEDPTNQYVYVSNYNDSTVTGYLINANTGQLSALTRTTVFPISGQASCLVVSGYTS